MKIDTWWRLKGHEYKTQDEYSGMVSETGNNGFYFLNVGKIF